MNPALEAVIVEMGWASAAVSPLDGGITNRNYRVDADGSSFAVRLAGEGTELLGIDRTDERLAAEASALVGVGPEVVAYLPEHGCLVTAFVTGGVPMAPEDVRSPPGLGLVVDAVRAFHGAGLIGGTFSPFRVVEDYRRLATDVGVAEPSHWVVLHDRAGRVEAALASAPSPPVLCHNDLLPANLLLDDGRVVLLDYEYAGMGDRFFDLGNLSVNCGFDETADEALLVRYFGAATDERRARLALMRFMSDFREGMWGVLQSGLSDLDFDFTGYAERHLGRAVVTEVDPWLSVLTT